MTADIISEKPHLFLGSRLERLAKQMQGDGVLMARQAGVAIQPGQSPLLATLDAHGAMTIGARRGYPETGETLPFPYDGGLGVPRRDDLCFIVLRKRFE